MGGSAIGLSHISTVSQTRATSRYCYMDVVWDGRTLDFPVSKEDFSAISAGDEVLVTAYDGFWGAPYYTWESPQSPRKNSRNPEKALHFWAKWRTIALPVIRIGQSS